MPGRSCLLFLLLVCAAPVLNAQKIIYSEPERDDSRRMDFEIVGKINGNFLIYKNNRNKGSIVALDNEMKMLSKEEHDYLPNDDRLINVEFFPYSDFAYMIYQYQKKNVVYCNAVKIDGSGKKAGDIMELDTSHIGFLADNKIYTVVTSEDKSRISVFKINSRNKRLYTMTTVLFNDKLEPLKRSVHYIPMEERNEYLGEFSLDNDGDLVFSKFLRNNNDNITMANMVVKKAMSDSLLSYPLNLEARMLDEIQVKVDNFNKRYFLTSFYYREKRGNIDGLYFFVWDKKGMNTVIEDTSVFSEDLRREARGDATMKGAFNDFFIRNVVTRKDGGFIISSESYYTTSRYSNNWNRWDYLYGFPYNRSLTNYYYSPYMSRYYWWNGSRSTSQAVRYHADNICVLSYNSNGKLEWSNVMAKSQYDDESDDDISFQLMNTGGQLHFLFNQLERRNNLLTDFSIAPDGQMNRNPTLKNLDKGYEFLPKYGKQVSARQMIIPCLYRNYICFAKIDYN
ncbi:MAG: hypothetical protein JNM88_15300 [Chitinophagaceae bacterium]|nr:hypothetical protein [Chitinophagaceae bacterium]